MTEQEFRRRATDSAEGAVRGRRATDRLEGAPHGRRTTDHSDNTRYGRRKTDRPANSRPSYAFRSFLEAWGIIIILIAIVVLSVSLYTRPVQVQVTPTVTTSVSSGDLPVIPGATLTRYALSGKTSVYNYSLAKGSKASVQGYYRAELEKRGWVHQPRSGETESEYKMGERRLVITLSYEGSHMLIQIRIQTSS